MKNIFLFIFFFIIGCTNVNPEPKNKNMIFSISKNSYLVTSPDESIILEMCVEFCASKLVTKLNDMSASYKLALISNQVCLVDNGTAYKKQLVKFNWARGRNEVQVRALCNYKKSEYLSVNVYYDDGTNVVPPQSDGESLISNNGKIITGYISILDSNTLTTNNDIILEIF